MSLGKLGWIKNFYTATFILIFFLSAFFGLYRIGKASINNGAHFWYTRTQNFTKALQKQRWNETYQNAKSGVTVLV